MRCVIHCNDSTSRESSIQHPPPGESQQYQLLMCARTQSDSLYDPGKLASNGRLEVSVVRSISNLIWFALHETVSNPGC
jgi:hypothetical protein